MTMGALRVDYTKHAGAAGEVSSGQVPPPAPPAPGLQLSAGKSSTFSCAIETPSLPLFSNQQSRRLGR